MPVWQQFHTRHQGDNVEVVTVALDAQGAEKARPYVEASGATFTTLVDEGGGTLEAEECVAGGARARACGRP